MELIFCRNFSPNPNIYFAQDGATPNLQLAYALVSAIVGFIFGIYICYATKNVCYGLTFAWAFYGLSHKTLNDCDVAKIIDRDSLETLGKIEQFMCYALLCVVVIVFQETW